MPVRLRGRVKPPPLSAPVWVAIIGAGSVILVAAVQFVIAPLLFRAEVPVRSPEQIKRDQQPSASATQSDASPRVLMPKWSGLDSRERRKNYMILASPVTDNGKRRFVGEPISMNLVNADIRDFVIVLAQATGVNFSLAPNVMGTATIHAEDTPWDAVFEDVLAQNNLEYKVSGDVVRIVPKAGTSPWKR